MLRASYWKFQKLLFFLLLLAGIAASCSFIDDDRYSGRPGESLEFPYYPTNAVPEPGKPLAPKVYPWELWTPERDLDGLPIVNFAILRGDKLNVAGDRSAAVEEYQKVDRRRLLPQEEEALIFRLAGTQLALGKYKEAITTLSSFFKRTESVDFVSPPFAILLGYAYGYNGNIEQSLAWFSRVHQINPPNRSYILIATGGAQDILSRVPAVDFERIAAAWRNDNFIRGLVAEERVLRSQRGVVTGLPSMAQPSTNMAPGSSTGSISVATLLPLTGKYAILGNNTKNGLDLALSGVTLQDRNNNSIRLDLVSRDAGENTEDVIALMNEIIATIHPGLFIGPLISEVAVAASEVARQNNIPLITFSKKSVFPTGGGIFRIGVTPESQVDTILASTADQMRLQKYALVYANDGNGLDFAAEVKRGLAQRGLSLVYERMYVKDDYSSFLAIAQELERYPVEALIFPDNLLSASRFFTNVSARYRSQVKIIGTASWDDPVQIARFNTILNGAIFVSPFFSGSTDDNIKRFKSIYYERFKSQPDFLAAQGYDVGILVLNSLQNALQQGLAFQDAFARIGEYNGLTGKISIYPDGQSKRIYTLVQFIEGVIRELPSGPAGNLSYIGRGDTVVNAQTISRH